MKNVDLSNTKIEWIVRKKYIRAFTSYSNELSKKLHLEECNCCHQLVPKFKLKLIDAEIINSQKEKHDTQIWYIDELMLIENLNFPIKVCRDYCYDELISNSLPKYSVLNNMKLYETPAAIEILNNFELTLIQLTKTFQSIIKLLPYSKKWDNTQNALPALKGFNHNF